MAKIIQQKIFSWKDVEASGKLREACGFDPALGERAVPSKDAYSSLLKKLMKKQDMIDTMFDKLIEELKGYLPDFGRHVGIQNIQGQTCGRQYMGEDNLMVWLQASSSCGHHL